jgi:hypothetical protein
MTPSSVISPYENAPTRSYIVFIVYYIHIIDIIMYITVYALMSANKRSTIKISNAIYV